MHHNMSVIADSRHRQPEVIGRGSMYHSTTYSSFLTCWRVGEGGGVVAQLLPLFAPAVDPDAEAHEDDPAGPADARDERRLLDHVCNLLGQAHAALLAAVAASASAAAS